MVNLKDLKVVKSFDIDAYNGVKTKIASVTLGEPKKVKFEGDEEKKETQQIEVKTENIALDGAKEFGVTAFISLKYDEDTKEFGIPDSLKSNAQKILKFFKVTDFEDLIGKDCVVVKTIKDNGVEHLRISY